VVNVNGNPRPIVAANFNDNSGVNALTTRPFNEFSRGDITGKLDFQITDGIDLQLTGYYGETEDQFTPNGWRVYNSHNNPTRFDTDYRIGARIRHRLGRQGLDASGEDLGVVQNASYVLQFGYENNQFERFDPRHGDNLFAYGHVANFDVDYAVPVFGIDTSGNLFHISNRAVLRGYDDTNSSNPVLANYNNIYGIDDFQGENLYGVPFGFQGDPAVTPIEGSFGIDIPTGVAAFVATNGFTQSAFTSSYSIHTNVGSVNNLFQRGDNDIFTFNANANLDIVPGGGNNTKNRHSIQFGIMYEQRTLRSYGVAPRTLWTLARQLANIHLDDPLTSNRQIGEVEVPGLGLVPIFAPTVEENNGQFYRSIRERMGIALDEYVNVDGMDPSQLSLDMFSARELNDAALLGYIGYDYLGNEFNGTFDDFFGEIDPATGLRGQNTFNVAPFRPIYTAAFIQDKFTINDMIFRLGVRIDRFDANTKVLSDPYSPFKLLGAADYHDQIGTERPGSIGEDFAVYLGEGGDNIEAYRSGDNWFLPDGTPVNGPQEIDAVRAGTTTPAFLNPEVQEDLNFIQNENFEVDDSFEDYEVQVNVMPRLSFSFPISDASNFFAHYDVLVQRPASNNVATALDYYYFLNRARTPNNPIGNPNLRPTTTIDYEIGFKQRLTPRSAITISAYYKEFRDMIQIRTYSPVPLVVGGAYTTYDNQDFGTTKGFNVTYDLRRTNNITINANYSLSFTDGTGSNTNTQRGLNNRGNIRALFPLDFDERHRINFIIDYRLDENTSVGLLKNAGLNIQSVAVSGRPYTATRNPTQFGGDGIIGAINGSRKPWTFTVNARLDKQIAISDKMGLNIYFRVSNLFNRRNVINVYSVTGSPEDPGWLQSQFGQDFLRETATQATPVDSFLAAYNWAVLNPGLFTQPRRMYLGTILSF
ncbi:MAG: TonB-dependent receptor, partial [Bacteroidota bacterium]